jgi:protein O-GlcNAc transferase
VANLGWTSGRWLDVGFGDGSLLTTAAEFGYDVVGLDLRAKNVEQLQVWGFEAHTLNIEDYEGEGFKIISMMDVLEHMPFPKRALKRANQLLCHGGVLTVSMPNVDSFVWKSTTTNPYWAEIEHYHNFGRSRLYELLKEHGFAPSRYRVSTRYRTCMEVLATKIQ